ncbi:MAG: COX15/CtaA family protein [Micrococcales bacterium]
MLFRLFDRLSLKLFVWLSLATQIGIVVTGGAVRLTGSGLGCPTWPKCTDDSLITVPEQGLHGVIEFGNRLLTFVLLVVSALTLILVWRAGARALRWPAIWLVVGIFVQAVLGGFTVLFKLSPWLVGAHFVVSAVMIAIASILVWRFYAPTTVIPQTAYVWATAISVMGWIAVLIGVLVTGAGPHSGDAETLRNGLDLEVWQHYHSYPAYLLMIFTLIQLIQLLRADRKVSELATRITLGLLIAEAAQAVIGVAQARLGVPPLLVGIHMLGASILISMITFNFLATRAK